MLAVRKKIASERIPCSSIIMSGRPMLTAVRARILRSEIDDISLSRALLIADAVGLDLSESIIAPPPPAKPHGPTLAEVLQQAREMQKRPRQPRGLTALSMGDLFAAA
jgi:hypothetical protein